MPEILSYLSSMRTDVCLNLLLICGFLYVCWEKIDWKTINKAFENWAASKLTLEKEKKAHEEKCNALLKSRYEQIEAHLTEKHGRLKVEEASLVLSIRDKQGHLDRLRVEIGPLQEQTDLLRKQQIEIVRKREETLRGQHQAHTEKEAELNKRELLLNGKAAELKELDVKIAENTTLVSRLDALCTYISGATNIKIEDLVTMFRKAVKHAQ